MNKSYSIKRLGAKELELIVTHAGARGLVVGVDVAKHELVLMIRRDDAQFIGPYRVINPDQIGEVIQLLKRLRDRGEVKVAMEPSGTYGDALRQALSEAQFELQRVQAKWSRDYAEMFDGVPSQHDGKDAAVIAELCAIGKSSAWIYRLADESESRMRWLVEWIDGQDRTRRLWIGRIEALLARHWPEATRLMDLTSGTLLRVLMEYGGPGELTADSQGLEKVMRWGGHWLGYDKAVALVESARTTLGVKQNDADRQRLGRYAREIGEASLEIKRSKRQLRELVKDNPVIQIQGDAVGVVTACVLWTRLGDPRNYPAAAAYRKAMGLNLTERSSGKYKGQLHISKRGNALVRRWLHLAALRLIRQYPSARHWYLQKRIRDGGAHRGALTAVVRRLAIALHRIGTREEKFDGHRLFAGIVSRSIQQQEDGR
jgi:transposase